MIPRAHIADWRARCAPWQDDGLVEQDLILSRAIQSIFADPELATRLRFRGGTCLQKLYLPRPSRYSEDIDLVQTTAEPFGPTFDRLRTALSWLGEAKSKRAADSSKLTFRFETEIPPVQTQRVKVEVNTREHFSVFDPVTMNFPIESPWYSAAASVETFQLDELLATKLRALYQRKKGRDLFDLWWAFQELDPEPRRIVHAFQKYLEHKGHGISRTEFEKNLDEKLDDSGFVADIRPLLDPEIKYDHHAAHELVREVLLVEI